MAVKHVNAAELELLIAGDTPVLVDFWAPWCGPCRMIAPMLEKLENQLGGKLIVAKVNVDEEQALAVRYNIMSIPAVFLFKNGEIMEQSVGLRPLSALEEMVQPYLA